MNHDRYSSDYLCDILGSVKNVAVVGASDNDARPSHWVMGFLLGKGYHVFPVNPAHAGKTILGQKVYARLSDLTEPMDMIDVFRSADHFGEVVDEVLALPLPSRPDVIWGQLSVRDDEAARKAEAAGLKVVMDRSLVTDYSLVHQRQHASRH